MTIETPQHFNVKSIAIIGAGPSGIASLYDLSRTKVDGTSLFGEKDISSYEKEDVLAFPELVAFERNGSIGGVWNKSSFGNNNKDPDYPDVEEHDYESLDPSDPSKIYKSISIDAKLEKELETSSVEKPVKVPFTSKFESIIKNQWRSSGAYNGLFTNVTNRYMQFSFHERVGKELEVVNTKYKNVPNFQSAADVGDYLEEAVKVNQLDKYIRFNTNVERITKNSSGKWEVVVSYISQENGEKYLNWYKQSFDAVIIGNGKTVPIIPNIKNLSKFAKVNKEKVIFRVAKTIRDSSFLKTAKKPLFIGSSVSVTDAIQYTFPRDLENPSIYISRQSESAQSTWVTLASHAKGIINKPTIEEFLPESNAVRFSDGTIESGFDVVIIGTGYHMYYPFIDKSVIELDPDNIFNWYKYTFSIADPTLALVGNTYAGFFFNRVESQAAALAGVWSNTTKLPSVNEQLAYSEKKPVLIPPVINKYFIIPLIKLAPKGRPHPFDINKEKHDHVYHVAMGVNTLLDLFFKIRNGEVDSEDILKVRNQ